jgi:hypothetical protein
VTLAKIPRPGLVAMPLLAGAAGVRHARNLTLRDVRGMSAHGSPGLEAATRP